MQIEIESWKFGRKILNKEKNWKIGNNLVIWKELNLEKISKFGNVKEKLEIIGKNWKLYGGKWRFRNEFGMKNDNWKYFGHLEIIWKI